MSTHARVQVHPQDPATPAQDTGLRRSTLLALCACVLVAQSMVAAINLLIPQLAVSSLRLTSSQLLWTVDAYVIVFAALLIPAGAVGDRWGRKGALLAGLGLFAAGAATSALATGPAALVAGRGVCGAGAALIMPATMSIVVRLAGPARMGQALAAWTLSAGLGGLAGNVVGGLVGEYLSWRALFWLMVPLAALLAGAVARTTPRIPANRAAALDPLGSLLITGALFALVHGIIEGPPRGWTSAAVLGSFAAGAVLLALFTAHGLRAARPLFDPRVFASRRLRAGTLGMATAFFGLFALFYVNAQYLQYAKGYSVAVAGLAIVPLTVGMVLVPKLASRAGAAKHRALAGGGLALIGVGLLLVSTADAATPYPLYALYLLVLSVGTGLCAPALTVTVVAALPAQQAGLGSGLNTAAREVGAALGVAVVGTVLAAHYSGTPEGPAQVAEFTSAMGTGLRAAALLVLLAAAAVWWGYRASGSASDGRSEG